MMNHSLGVLSPAEVNNAVARIMSGEAFTGLSLDDTAQRAAALESVLDKVVDDGTRVAWVGNPLRSPLTIERFLIQIVGPEIDLRIERSPVELGQLITGPVGEESRLLIVVQQPETINAETRDLLGAIERHLGDGAVQAQFLFAGTLAFTLPTGVAAKPSSVVTRKIDEPPPEPSPRRREVLPLLSLLLAVSLGVLISMVKPVSDGLPVVASQIAVPETTARAAPAPVTDTAALRREFDVFLAQRASNLPPMSDSQKDSLFAEFLARHLPARLSNRE